MAILHTQLNTRSPEFAANRAVMLEQVLNLRALLAHVHTGGGAKAQERHTSRGKLLPRERINGLLDPGSAFLEVAPLAAYEVYGDEEYTGWLMENNFPLLDTFVFDAGVVLQTPAPPEQTAANDLPIWRSKV